MANYQTVAVCTASTGLVENVLWIDTDIDPPSGWPSNWVTAVGKVNTPSSGFTYVPVLNGFVPPQPNPTFDLRTSDLTWNPDPGVYYYWTTPIDKYYLWSVSTDTWLPQETLPPGAQTSEIVNAPIPEYTLTCDSPTVTPGGTVAVTLTNTNGQGGPGSVSYEIIGPPVLEDVKQQFSYTVGVVPGITPSVSGFLRNGVVSVGPSIANSNNFEFVQDDPSNDGNTLLLSTTLGGTHNGGTTYETGVFYYLDGVQVANSAAYIAGFDAATTRKLSVTIDPLLTGNLFPYSVQTADFQTGMFDLVPNSLGKYGGLFFNPLSGPSTIYITVEPGYVPPSPTEMIVKIINGFGDTQEVSFTIVPV
jgi:hypothetical protein